MAEQSDPAKVAAALVDLAQWLDGAQGDAGWLAALRFGVAGALAETPHKALAEAGFRQIIAQSPQHLWAWVGLISLVLARGDAGQAAMLGQTALGHLPQEPILRRKTAEALEQADGPDAALACLVPGAQPPAAPEDLAYAIMLLRSAQRVAEAGPFCAALLDQRPHDALALLARIELGLAQGDDDAALQAALDARAHHPDHPEIRLRSAQVHRRMGQTRLAAELIATPPDDPTLAAAYDSLRATLGAADPDLGRAVADPAALGPVLDALLQKGPKQGDRDGFIALVATSGPLPWYHALDLVARAYGAGQGALGDAIAAAVAVGQWPAPDQLAFAVEHALLCHGPLAALDLLRATAIAARDPEAAARLGRVLLRAGQAGLAARYLGRCLRKWPGDAALQALACAAQIAAGRVDLIDDLLAGDRVAMDAGRALHYRLAAAFHLRRADRLRHLCMLADDPRMERPPMVQLIKAHLLSGDLAAAEEWLGRLDPHDDPLAAALIQRPRATWLGSLLNEARLLAVTARAAPVAATDQSAAMAQEFFLPARALIATMQAMPVPTPPPSGARAVPRPVHLLWPRPAPTTPEGQRLAAAWAAQMGRPITPLSLADGGAWMARHHGAAVAKAYRLLRDPDQKSDLLLYGHLLQHGGIGLGAPLWPQKGIVGRLEAFGPTRFFLDDSGAPSTAMILCLPQDKIIAHALDLAVAAILARENEDRWFKTGPGLLARALASLHLRGDIADPVPLAPITQLYRLAHPYNLAMP
jgi:cellulose synthase operon protein C